MTDKPTYEQLETRVQELENELRKQKNVEESLKTDEQIIQSIFRAAPTGIGMVSERTLVKVNDRLCEMTGYVRNELLGRNARILYPADEDYEFVGREKYRQIKNYGSGTVETKFKRKDGKTIDILMSSTPLDQEDWSKGVTFTALDITGVKKTREALKQSENKFRNLSEMLPVAVFETDEQLNIDYANQKAMDQFGYTQQDVENGLNSLTMVAPAEHQKVAENLQKRIKGELKGPSEYTAMKRDGSTFPALLYISAKEEWSKGIRGAIVDITERSEALAALKQAKERTETILHTIQSGLLVIDASTHRIIEVNQSAEKMIGLDRESIIGQVCHQFICPKKANHCPITDNGQLIDNTETQLLCSNGSQKEILKNVTTADIDGRQCLIESFVDITELKQAQADASDHQERFRVFFSSIQDAIFVHPFMEEGFAPFIEVNDIACRRYGYSRDEFLKLRASDITQQTFARQHAEPEVRKRLLESSHLAFEAVHIKKNGEEFPVEINSNIVKQFGNPVIIAVVRDISDRRRNEKEKERLQFRLQQAQKMEALGTLAGGIAHDFNNILSGIFGYAQLADLHIDDHLRAKADIQNIIKGASRAADLVQQILTFSRRTDYKKTVLPFYVIAKEVIKLMRATIPTTIDIKSIINSKSSVMADPTQMHQMIMNLCTNAYHAMIDSGGKLTIRLDEKTISEKNQDRLPAGRYLELEISDTGHGINQHNLNRIFEPYFTTKTREKGTGLGLALVHAIVEEHEGRIKVRSSLGIGTSFIIHLPVLEKDGQESVKKKEREIIPTGTESILFVDDEEGIRSMMKDFMENQGYKLTLAENGSSAFEKFSQAPDEFDLIITDMAMPKMTGDELVKKILKLRADIPVMLCSGYTEKLNETLAKEIGITKFLHKPVGGKELCFIVRDILDKYKPV